MAQDLDKDRPNHRKALKIDITQQRVMRQRDLTLSQNQLISIAFELKVPLSYVSLPIVLNRLAKIRDPVPTIKDLQVLRPPVVQALG